MFHTPEVSSIAPIISLIIGIGLFVVGLFFVVTVAFVAYSIVKRSKSLNAISDRAATAVDTVDITDGIDAKELEIIKAIFLKQKQAEAEAAAKEKMVRAAGYDAEA